ncbi:tetratricopeptide repeat protein [Holophaga foetida]|uniref:tetratricopeptide repeat protein n=1 Tax=Holophaga foetida TaxID=35839 RepID=UPI0002471C34|nr:tetratricopeptide repeat protein [Holophaga foetida]
MNASQRMLISRLLMGLALPPVLLAGTPAQTGLDRARRLYRAKDYLAAVEAYRKVVAMDPAHQAAWRELGRCYQQLGRSEDALLVWDNLLRLEPRDSHTLNAAGETLLGLGRFDRAARLLERSLQVDGSQKAIRVRLGEAYEGLQAWEKAARQYEEVLRQEPGNLDLLLHRARVEEQEGQLSAAILRLEGFLHQRPSAGARLRPTLTRLYATAGDQAYQAGDFTLARQALEKGLQGDPGNPHLLIALGWAQRRMGESAGALAVWRRVPAVPDAVRANLVRGMAEASLELDDLAEARRFLEEARRLVPGEPAPCLQLLELGLRQGEGASQESALQALLTLPGLDGTWADRAAERFLQHGQIERGISLLSASQAPELLRGRALGRLYAAQASSAYQADHLEEAIRLDRLALDRDLGNRQALRDLGWAFARKGDWSACTAAWSAFVRHYPEMPDSHDLLAQAFLFQRNYQAAIVSEGKALALDPTLKGGRLRLMQAFAMDGQLALARDLGTQLAQAFPEDLAVQYRYAEVLTRLGDHAVAREVWGRVRRLDPEKVRPVQNWIRESYAMEDYGAALSEALRLAGARPSHEGALLFLAQDAELLGNYAEAARWYGRLTDDHPEQAVYWKDRLRLLRLGGLRDQAIRTAAEALTHLPSSVELGLVQAELGLEAGDAAALGRFHRLAAENPGNVSAYQGLVRGLMQARQFGPALDRLQGAAFKENFLSGFERELWRADALIGLGEGRAAEAILQGVAHPQGDCRYLPILLYHGIQPQERTASISAARLEEQLAAIAKAGYTAITMTELARMVAGQEPWPRRPILITFDDARSDSFVQADPILARYGLKATMFVPAGDSAAEADLFHASWKSIRRFGETGRWDMQGHGFEAHDPVVVDAQGHTGKFLIERAWIPDLRRVENDQEFQARVDEDYRRCREALVDHLAQRQPLAYAFPYSEAGQTSVSGMEQAAAVNDAVWRRYFRFGMVQDSRGFNSLRSGEEGQRLLWRFEPPRTWGGPELLAHLARRDPANMARLKLAQLRLWEGYPERARRELAALERELPDMHADCERILADIAWAEDRPREAATHLKASQVLASAQAPADEPVLGTQLRWANDPGTGIGAETLEGSDHRSRNRVFTTFHVPFRGPLDLDLRMGAFRFADKALGHLDGREVEGRLAWAPGTCLNAAFWGGRRTFGALPDRNRGGLELHGRFETQEVRLDLRRDDLDTMASLEAGIRQWKEGVNYALRSGKWNFEASASEAHMTDGNRQGAQEAAVLFQPGILPRWQFGLDLQCADSRTQSSLYYTPMDYRAARFRARYQHPFPDGSGLDLDLAGGGSDDRVNGGRLSGSAALNWVKLWTPHVRTRLNLGAGSTTGYTSRQAALTVEWRF